MKSMQTMDKLARLCAILAGLLLIFITLMTCTSVVGRELVGKTIVGDFELSGAAAGAAIALFMPWCQVRRGNIMVDFFTTKASPEAQAAMERTGALLLAVVMALMAWRTSLGGLNAWNNHSGTMMLNFPEWVIYLLMVPPLTLTAIIALHQCVFGFAPDVTEDNPELAL